MMKTISSACLALALLSVGTSLASASMPASADKAAPAMMIDKASFVKTVTSANGFEIESSKLAEQKATAPDVKEFAAQMIKDHTMAQEELNKASGMMDSTMSMAPMLSPKHQAMLKTLEGATGNDFQALYIEMQTVAHMEAVTLFATYTKGGDDAALKKFAAKTLPKLEMHKMHVLKLVAMH